MEKGTKCTIIYFVMGIIIGYIGYLLNSTFGSLSLALFTFYILFKILKKVLKIEEKLSWFLTNGGLVFFFTWFVSWILFFNLL